MVGAAVDRGATYQPGAQAPAVGAADGPATAPRSLRSRAGACAPGWYSGIRRYEPLSRQPSESSFPAMRAATVAANGGFDSSLCANGYAGPLV